ncbi:hypothetical protein [Phaeodactylibacter luteus]|uniref:VacJ n=1 Tax=Phaeodactylibacter luteus TaxID=1564516 RepID=A0A5C6RHJ0_9BACT|nr:hypothetical protein [Phaeodactylibacter luteus]TXB61484.1 hypothetical protein FRY97_18895 [Phaeodactylibacter luteus]
MDFFRINRTAVVTRPKPALIAWANEIFPEDPVSFEDMDQHDEQDIFLLPDLDGVEEVEAYLKQNVSDLLGALLEDWCMDESDWPSPLDWELFVRFFEYHIETVVVDTVEED